jgi:hypothetical protein
MFTSPYALYRIDAPSAGDALLNWDPDRRLTTCLALSRIVQPTSIAFANAARIISWPNRPVEIIAAYVYQKAAWISPGERDWLTDADVAALGLLMSAFRPQDLPERVKRALWYLEGAFQTHPIDVRWTLVVTALEALVHTDERTKTTGKYGMGNTKQFTHRLTRLKEYLPSLQWSPSSLGDIYEARSGLSHGQGFVRGQPAESWPLPQPVEDLYSIAEGGLRAILGHAILHPEFRAIFSGDESLRLHLA